MYSHLLCSIHKAMQASEYPCSIAATQKSPTFGLGKTFFASLCIDIKLVCYSDRYGGKDELSLLIHMYTYLHSVLDEITSLRKSLHIKAHSPANLALTLILMIANDTINSTVFMIMMYDDVSSFLVV